PHLNTDTDKQALTRRRASRRMSLRDGDRGRTRPDAVLTGPCAVDEIAERQHRGDPSGLDVDVVDGAHRGVEPRVRPGHRDGGGARGGAVAAREHGARTVWSQPRGEPGDGGP